ncbi:MAG: hypothetical protein LBB14_00490 [Puniceicoccales bacterium]|nr:hypothetical protein [Puniceicoccales bacterium]
MMPSANPELPLATRVLGRDLLIAELSSALAVSEVAVLGAVQTMLAETIVLGSIQHRLHEIMHCPTAVGALFYFLCCITLGIFLIYSLATYGKPMGSLVELAAEELQNNDRVDGLAEAQVSAAAAGLLLPMAEDEGIGKALCGKIVELTQKSPLDLSRCKIASGGSADPAESLENAVLSLNKALAMEKEDGAEDYPLRLRPDLPLTKESADRWNEFVDLLDRYGQLRHAEVDIKEEEEKLAKFLTTSDYKDGLITARADAYISDDINWDTVNKSKFTIEIANIARGIIAKEGMPPSSSTEIGNFLSELYRFRGLKKPAQKCTITNGYDYTTLRNSSVESLQIYASDFSFIMSSFIGMGCPISKSSLGEFIAMRKSWNAENLSLSDYPISCFNEKILDCGYGKEFLSYERNFAGLENRKIGDHYSEFKDDDWSNIEDSIPFLREYFVDVFLENKIYRDGTMTGPELLKDAEDKYNESLREPLVAARKKLEFQRLSWLPKPAEKPENGEKLLVHSVRGIFEPFSDPQKLSNGTETSDPVPLLLDKLREVTQRKDTIGPIRIDPNASDVAEELNRKLGSKLVCLSCTQQNHKEKIQAFIAEFNRYSALIHSEWQLHDHALCQISKSLFNSGDSATLSPLKAFRDREVDVNDGKSAVARVQMLKIPSQNCDGEEPAKGVVRISDIGKMIDSWEGQWREKFFEFLRSSNSRGKRFRLEESFPPYEKKCPREKYMAQLGAGLISEGKDNAPISYDAYVLLKTIHEEKMAFLKRLTDLVYATPVTVQLAMDGKVDMPAHLAYSRLTGPIASDDSDKVRAHKAALQEAQKSYGPTAGA